VTAGRGDERHARIGEIGEHLPVGGGDNGSGGNLEDEILPARTVAVITSTVSATRRREVRAEVQIQEGMNLGGGAQDDIATVPAVATIGPSEWLELFAVHRRAPVATVAGGEVQDDTIYETISHELSFNRMRRIVYSTNHQISLGLQYEVLH